MKVCGSTETIHIGKKIHDDILRKGSLKKNIALWKALVAMYAHNGLFLKAREVLEEIPIRDVVTWNVLITGYTQQGKGHEATNSFELMQMEGINPDASTLSCILKACGSTKYLGKGEEIHKEIIRRGLLENDALIGTALVDCMLLVMLSCQHTKCLMNFLFRKLVLGMHSLQGILRMDDLIKH